MCPLVAGGTVAVAGEFRAGTLVVVEELARRLGAGNDRLSIFALVPGPMTTSFEEVWEKEGYSGGTVGPLQTFYFLREEGPWTREEISAIPRRGLGDPPLHRARGARDLPHRGSRSARAHGSSTRGWSSASTSRSRPRPRGAGLARASADHPCRRARSACGQRARKLQRFFAQPFFVAEPYTKRPGLHVSRAEALRGCRAILDGEIDALPEQAFYFTGTLDDVLKAAAAMPPAAPGAPSPARPG